MKNTKLTKTIQIILATVFVSVVAGILVMKFTNDYVLGASVVKCDCGGTMTSSTKSNGNGTHSTTLKCNSCGSSSTQGTPATCSKVYQSTTNNSNGTHTKNYKCNACGYKQSVTSNCSSYYETSGYITNSEQHTIKKRCTECGYTKKGESAAHVDGNHSNDGKCGVCNYQYQTHTLSKTGYRGLGNGAHVDVYTCAFSGCDYSREGGTEGCSGGNHANSGKCEKCGQQYQVHKMVNTGTCKSNGNGTHKLELKCTIAGCNYTDYGPVAECTGGNHENDGVCEICGDKYQTHNETSNWLYNGNGTHSKGLSCSCGWYELGGTQFECDNEIAIGIHENGDGYHTITKKCITCNYEYNGDEECDYKISIGIRMDGDGKHDVRRECSICKYTSEGEESCEWEEKFIPTEGEENTHTLSKSCKVCRYIDERMDTGVCYNNEGNCYGTCELCGRVLDHTPGDKTNYVEKDAVSHYYDLECYFCGEIFQKGLTEYCYNSYGDCEGRCIKCGNSLFIHDYEVEWSTSTEYRRHILVKVCQKCSDADPWTEEESCRGISHLSRRTMRSL